MFCESIKHAGVFFHSRPTVSVVTNRPLEHQLLTTFIVLTLIFTTMKQKKKKSYGLMLGTTDTHRPWFTDDVTILPATCTVCQNLVESISGLLLCLQVSLMRLKLVIFALQTRSSKVEIMYTVYSVHSLGVFCVITY